MDISNIEFMTGYLYEVGEVILASVEYCTQLFTTQVRQQLWSERHQIIHQMRENFGQDMC